MNGSVIARHLLIIIKLISCIVFVIRVAERLVQHFVVVLQATHKQRTARTEALHDSVNCKRRWTGVNVALNHTKYITWLQRNPV